MILLTINIISIGFFQPLPAAADLSGQQWYLPISVVNPFCVKNAFRQGLSMSVFPAKEGVEVFLLRCAMNGKGARQSILIC